MYPIKSTMLETFTEKKALMPFRWYSMMYYFFMYRMDIYSGNHQPHTKVAKRSQNKDT